MSATLNDMFVFPLISLVTLYNSDYNLIFSSFFFFLIEIHLVGSISLSENNIFSSKLRVDPSHSWPFHACSVCPEVHDISVMLCRHDLFILHVLHVVLLLACFHFNAYMF